MKKRFFINFGNVKEFWHGLSFYHINVIARVKQEEYLANAFLIPDKLQRF